MTESLEMANLAASLREGAATRGLVAYGGAPLLTRSAPVTFWTEEWGGFLDLANKAGAVLVYVRVTTFDRQERLDGVMDSSGFGDPYDVDDEDDDEDDEDKDEPPAIGSAPWLFIRLLERTDEWAVREGTPSEVSGLWFGDGIAHLFHRQATWLASFDAATEEVLDEARQVKAADRRLHSDEEAKRLHRLAGELARHPRYHEATSEAKREYMAEQVFPEEDLFHLRRIAARAALIYWWDVEPSERVGKAERVRQLYDAGETMAGIAAILNVSREKVKRMLVETESIA